MLTLEDLIARRDALLAARLAGTRAVEVEGVGRVEYKNDADMRAAIAAANAAIADAGSAKRVSQVRIASSKGL